jgi:mRNA interferase HigB
MRIVTYKRIQEFATKHPNTQAPLNVWYHTITAKSWQNLTDIKHDFNSVDYVGNHRYVFNIKGNSYRLIALISFNAQKVYIRFIGTHAAYDRIKDIKTI